MVTHGFPRFEPLYVLTQILQYQQFTLMSFTMAAALIYPFSLQCVFLTGRLNQPTPRCQLLPRKVCLHVDRDRPGLQSQKIIRMEGAASDN
jgi:hypothetical protein